MMHSPHNLSATTSPLPILLAVLALLLITSTFQSPGSADDQSLPVSGLQGPAESTSVESASAALFRMSGPSCGRAPRWPCLPIYRWARQVAQTLQETKAKQTLFLSDACHAGAFAESQLAIQAELAKSLQEIERVLVFASSEGEELSLERDEWGHGAFTKALLEGIDGHADANEDGGLSIGELIAYTTERVTQLTDRKQHPYLPKREGYDPALILARTRPAERKASTASTSPGEAPASEPFGVLTQAADVMDATTVLGRVPAGTRFRIEREQNGWLKGTFDINGQATRGWVSADAVQKNPPQAAPVIAP